MFINMSHPGRDFPKRGKLKKRMINSQLTSSRLTDIYYASFSLANIFHLVILIYRNCCQYLTGVADRNASSIVGKPAQNLKLALDEARSPISLYVHKQCFDLRFEIPLAEK